MALRQRTRMYSKRYEEFCETDDHAPESVGSGTHATGVLPVHTSNLSAETTYRIFFVCLSTTPQVTAFGFLTFGGASSGYILNNYATTDRLAAVARVAVASSLVFSYPLCFVGLRDGIREMRGSKPGETKNRTRWTVGLLAGVTAASLKLTDLGFVNSFGGALIGSGIVYVFPALMFLKPLMRRLKDKAASAVGGEKGEMSVNVGIVAAGVAMGVLGCAVSVLETFTNVLG